MTRFLAHPKISERYFFPRPGALRETFWVSGKGGRLACYRAAPHSGARTLIHFHGNGEVVADYLPAMATAFTEMGVNVLFAEYRGYGSSEGKPNLLDMLDDVDALFSALGLPPQQLVVFGRSVGAIYAVEMVHRHPGIWGLILESGVADVLQRIRLRVSPEEVGATEESFAKEARQRFDHRAKLSKFKGHLLILHARNDSLVGVEHARQHYDWAARATRRSVLFPRGDHNTLFTLNQAQYLAEVGQFLSGAKPVPAED